MEIELEDVDENVDIGTENFLSAEMNQICNM